MTQIKNDIYQFKTDIPFNELPDGKPSFDKSYFGKILYEYFFSRYSTNVKGPVFIVLRDWVQGCQTIKVK